MFFNATRLFLLCSLLFTTAPVSSAEIIPDGAKHDFMINNAPLSADELRSAFTDQSHVGHYRFERKLVETDTFSETTFKDGRVEHVQGGETLSGQWKIVGDQMCYTYTDVWFNQLCFDMYRVGNCYYHYLMTEGTRAMRVWTARSTINGERPNCEPGIS